MFTAETIPGPIESTDRIGHFNMRILFHKYHPKPECSTLSQVTEKILAKTIHIAGIPKTIHAKAQ